MRYLIGFICGIIFFYSVQSIVADPEIISRAQAPAPAPRLELREFEVTAYCPCRKCCGQYADGITASGHKIRPGDRFVAAAKNIPFGSWITIPDYGRVQVLDRGGAIGPGRLDVFFPSHAEALKWGRKNLICSIVIELESK